MNTLIIVSLAILLVANVDSHGYGYVPGEFRQQETYISGPIGRGVVLYGPSEGPTKVIGTNTGPVRVIGPYAGSAEIVGPRSGRAYIVGTRASPVTFVNGGYNGYGGYKPTYGRVW